MDRLKIPALSFETPYAFIGKKPMDRNDYLQAGETLAASLVNFIHKSH